MFHTYTQIDSAQAEAKLRTMPMATILRLENTTLHLHLTSHTKITLRTKSSEAIKKTYGPQIW